MKKNINEEIKVEETKEETTEVVAEETPKKKHNWKAIGKIVAGTALMIGGIAVMIIMGKGSSDEADENAESEENKDTEENPEN